MFPVPLPKTFSAQSAAVSRTSDVLEIPFFKRYLPYSIISHLQNGSTPVAGVEGLSCCEDSLNLTDISHESLTALGSIYESVKDPLKDLLEIKIHDNEFIDQRTRAYYELNYSLLTPFSSDEYVTMVGGEDTEGRVVVGPIAPEPPISQRKDLKLSLRRKESDEGAESHHVHDFLVPSCTLLYKNQPLPSFLIDILLPLFRSWHNPSDLVFHVNCIENEEDANFLRSVLDRSEAAVRALHPEYSLKSIRVIVAIRSPRSAFRLNEIIDSLGPFFGGMMLDWDKYMAACVRQFKMDSNYSLPNDMPPSDRDDLLTTLTEGHQFNKSLIKTVLLLNHSESRSRSVETRPLREILEQYMYFLCAWFCEDGGSNLNACSLSELESIRWRIWHQIRSHRSLSLNVFLCAVLRALSALSKREKMLDTEKKWLTVSLKILVILCSQEKPIEDAMQLLLPYRLKDIRCSASPWDKMQTISPDTYALDDYSEKFCSYFSICGNIAFASTLSMRLVLDINEAEGLFKKLNSAEIEEINSFQKEPVKSSDIRTRLWESISLQLRQLPSSCIADKLESMLSKYRVAGCSLSISVSEGALQSFPLGNAIVGNLEVTKNTRFEVASLSKSVASCFAIEYFHKKKIPLSTPVNLLLEQYSSPYRIPSENSLHSEWGDNVTISQLMDHSALNMHYVNGIPLEDPLPSVYDLITGSLSTQYGYSKVCAPKEPGSSFGYSGGGFLVLQHLIEQMEGKDIVTLTQPFVKHLGMDDFTFDQKDQLGYAYASGYRDSGESIAGGRRMHPAFPAGGMGTAHDIGIFLTHLTRAYNNNFPDCPISHGTAVEMLYGLDKGSQQFMGARMGLGIFVAETGENKLAIHQGANDGFRCLFVHCFSGPDRGKGFVIHCNGELNAVMFIAEAAQLILRELHFSGIDESRFKNNFMSGGIPSEEIVNTGYKKLIFDAFEPDNAEKIVRTGSRDPWADFNLAVGGRIKSVTNQRFARAENLLSEFLPTFEPKLFGRQGKVMNSWESARHNPLPFDTLIFELGVPSQVHFVAVSTQFHLGNQAQEIAVDGRSSEKDGWVSIIPRCRLKGHSKLMVLSINDESICFSEIRVLNIPDGGISRLGLYNKSTLSVEHHELFKLPGIAENVVFTDPVPGTVKPLAPHIDFSLSTIQRIWDSLPVGCKVDLASSALGGAVFSASDEHYGPAKQTISPFPPLSMFDGLESARSRTPGHFVDVVIKLARVARVSRIEIDMTYFVNNNPLDMEVLGANGNLDVLVTLVPKKRLKGYAGNFVEFVINSEDEFSHIKFVTLPDGGFNRIKIYSFKV